MTTFIFIVLLSLFAWAEDAGSEIIEGTSDVSAYSGVMESGRGSRAFLVGARFAFHFTESRTVEGSFGVAFPEQAKLYTALVNYRFNITTWLETLVFTIAGGGGVARFSSDGQGMVNSTDVVLDFGGGILYFASDYIGLRFDLRDNLILSDDVVDDRLEASGGIAYFFY